MAFIEFETEEAYNEAIGKAIEEKNQSWISDRLQTARNKAIEETKAQYHDYDELKQKVSDYGAEKTSLLSQIEELKTQAATHESTALKLRAAAKHGIPFDMADRIAGKDEKEIFEDAEKLSKFLTPAEPKKSAPLKNTNNNAKNSAWAGFLADFNN